MKLIHLPTNKEIAAEKDVANEMLESYPKTYIRAELPEYWRVEGYDKSWEWATPEGVKCEEGKYIEYDVVAYNKFGYNHSACHTPNLPEISRAEFEHHIYKTWMEQQEEEIIKKYMSQPIIMTFTPDLQSLKQQAEAMGYELVRKKEGEKRWESEDNQFCFYNDELSCCIVDKTDGHDIVLDREEITQLIKEVGHIIEKYEEFI